MNLQNLPLEVAIKEKIGYWLTDDYDEKTRESIQKFIDDKEVTELTDAFYRTLEFGTGGLRGIMGVGSNRINRYTIGAATQGLCNYLKVLYPNSSIKVAIAHDSRNDSSTFANITADVFSANGIQVYLFEKLRPTPELSFAIRHLNCQSGVVVTASHNPKEYNGYKVYGEDGGQVVAPHDKNIILEVGKIQSNAQILWTRNSDLVTLLDNSFDELYFQTIRNNVVSPEIIDRQKKLKIVYSALHGTGIEVVPKALETIGFQNITIVKKGNQHLPNGDFPSVIYPNPEEKEAMTLGLELAKELDADILMATDPDSDRVGVGVKNPNGDWELLNGNQIATLMIYYLLTAWKSKNKLTGKEFIAKTIVTTDCIHAVCQDFGVKCYDTLTGFKYIASVILALEGKEKFIAGGEESYGYLIGDAVRDKDAVASCAMIAEVTAAAKDKGLTLFDFLAEIYTKYNFYYEGLISLTKKGKAGTEEIQALMTDLRTNLPQTIVGKKPIKILDYKSLIETDLKTNTTKPISKEMGIESSDVLQIILEDGTKISARPSGTEPKIKFYISVYAPLASKNDYWNVLESLRNKVNLVKKDLNLH